MAKKITFKSITIEGYRSYVEETKFTFDTKGLYLIRGLNGAGKTTLFGAIIWALYKYNISSTENANPATWKKRRSANWRGTRVALFFTVDDIKYMIARHINFTATTKGIEGGNRLMLYKDGTEVADGLYKEDQQAYINRLMGMDANVAVNSLIFGQKMSRIMATKDKNKRELFESMIDTDFIAAALQKANTLQNETDNKLLNAQQELSKIHDKIEGLIETFNNNKRIQQQFEQLQEERINALLEDHKHHKSLLGKYIEEKKQLLATSKEQTDTASLDDFRELTDASREKMFQAREAFENNKRNIIDFDRQITQIGITIKKLKKEMELSDTCPYCGNKLDKAKVDAVKKKLLQKINDEEALKKALETKKAAGEKKEEEFNRIYEERKELYNTNAATYNNLLQSNKATKQATNALSDINAKIEAKKERLAELLVQIEKERNEEPPKLGLKAIRMQIDELKGLKPDLEKQIRIYTKKQERLTFWKKAFGAGGLKNYIFSSMLNTVNEYIKLYTAQFGIGEIKFGIDLSKASKPFTAEITYDGIVIDYDDISGGQKTRIDIAVAFAMFDIVSASSAFSIIMFDEPLSSLDAEGKEIVIQLIKLKAKKRAVYLIEHDENIDITESKEITVSGGLKTNSKIEY